MYSAPLIHSYQSFAASARIPVLRWSVLDPRRRDFWGNTVIPSWYSEASVVLGLNSKVQPVTELAQTAEVTVGADGFAAPSE
jgi:catechol 2,3-dioxygenase